MKKKCSTRGFNNHILIFHKRSDLYQVVKLNKVFGYWIIYLRPMSNLIYTNAAIEKLAVHYIGNKNNEEEIRLSQNEAEIASQAEEILINYFLSPVKLNEYYQFWHESELLLNEVNKFCTDIFERPQNFLKASHQIAKHLYAQTLHPKIKSGELCVAYLTGCVLDGEEDVEAIAIFKSENKDNVLRTRFKEGSYTLSPVEGISVNKLDKACLVFNSKRNEGYKVCIADQGAKAGEEAHYWKDDFLQVRLSSDEYNNTKHFLKLTKSFITTALADEKGLGVTEQADLLDRSIRFFKNNETINTQKFQEQIFEDEETIQAFNSFGSAYITSNNIDIAAEFPVAEHAVKKYEKNYRSVIKLDRNFHIYVHGNPSLIERGEDNDGRKFYKLYYENEG